jgi:hypothetical protein
MKETRTGRMDTMKKLAASLLIAAVLGSAAPALATDDLGEGACRQTDGAIGLWNLTTADDAGCITADEYSFMFSAQNLKDAGVIVDYVVNDDGTTDLIYEGVGPNVTVPSDPLDSKVEATPGTEPNAPTVRDIFAEAEARGVPIS